MIKRHGVRNGYTTVIAPTGSISMIAGCSSGIEPIYSLVFEKHVKVGSFYYIDPVFEHVMTEEGLFGEELAERCNRTRRLDPKDHLHTRRSETRIHYSDGHSPPKTTYGH